MKYLFIIISLSLGFQLHASHIVGGEMYYDCLGNNKYRVTIKLYRDCNSMGANFDAPLYLGVFNTATSVRLETIPVGYPGSVHLPVVFSNPCVTPPSDICVEEAVYTKVITLSPSSDGYTLVYQRCCRGPGIINLMNPANEGLTLTSEIPGNSNGVTCNSSPRFDNYPPLLLCNNDDLDFDHSATDPDGDELVYELCTPFNGGTSGNPMPNPPNNPPYNPIVWENGFTETIPFGNGSSISIDQNTGQLIASPDLIGKFVVGVCVKEYRNGELIGSTKRDFLFTVFNCEISAAAEVVAQDELSTFESQCDGLTVDFENNSYGGSNYEWDFGVENDPNSTSTDFEPSYTFPSEGTYEVTLYLNPGWPCSDSSVEIFTVYEGLNISYEPPEPQCINENSFDFVGEGDYGSGATFLWEFGNNANPNESTTESVNNVEFDSPGIYPVSYTVQWNTCEETYEDSIEVHEQPQVDFGVLPDLFCAPDWVEFIDSSQTSSDLDYFWDFGDGTNSTAKNPVHLYDQPGVYDISLEIKTKEGCIDTLFINKPQFIEVFPSPVANFSVTPSVTNVFDTEVFIADQSIDSEEHFYQLNEEIDTSKRNLNFHFLEGGYHHPYQVVTNEFGCKDTAYRTVFVEPKTTFYIPTAFTPDNNKFNEIFKPKIMDVSNYQFEIYNRWGNKIFKTNNTEKGWNGRINGKLAPDGVYIWKIKYTNHRNINHVEEGHFSLLR